MHLLRRPAEEKGADTIGVPEKIVFWCFAILFLKNDYFWHKIHIVENDRGITNSKRGSSVTKGIEYDNQRENI